MTLLERAMLERRSIRVNLCRLICWSRAPDIFLSFENRDIVSQCRKSEHLLKNVGFADASKKIHLGVIFKSPRLVAMARFSQMVSESTIHLRGRVDASSIHRRDTINLPPSLFGVRGSDRSVQLHVVSGRSDAAQVVPARVLP